MWYVGFPINVAVDLWRARDGCAFSPALVGLVTSRMRKDFIVVLSVARRKGVRMGRADEKNLGRVFFNSQREKNSACQAKNHGSHLISMQANPEFL